MAKAKSNRRRKTKERTQNDSGWVALVVGVLVATFFGGGVRALLSERQIHQWIDKQISKENPAFQLEFQAAQVVLSDGWIPKFGLLVKDLNITAKDSCKVPYRLNVKEVFLPSTLSVLWGERLRFGTIRAEALSIEAVTVDCPVLESPNGNQNGSKSARPSNSNEVEDLPMDSKIHGTSPLKKYFAERWAIDLNSLSRWIEGFSFNDVHISGLKGPVSKVEIPQIQFDVDDKQTSSVLMVAVRLPEEFEQTLGTKPIEFEFHLKPEQIEILAKGALREGRVQIKSRTNLAELTHDGQIELSFLAADQVIELLRKWNVVTDPIEIKRNWLSGEIRWQGEWEVQKLRQIEILKLKLAGEGGEVRLSDLKLEHLQTKGWQFKPFHLVFDKYSLGELLGSLGRQGYRGVIRNFGALSGEMSVTNRDEINFVGHINNLEVGFSRQNIRALQKFSEIHGEIALKNNRVSGLVNSMALENGLAKGIMSFNLDRQFLNGIFQIRLDELQLQPEVQKVMTGAMIAPLAFYGQGRIKDGLVTHWSGEFGTSKLDGSDWSVTGLKVRSEFANELMILSIKAESGDLLNDNEWLKALTPRLNRTTDEVGLQVRHLGLRMEIERGKGRWKNGVAVGLNQGFIFATQGVWENAELKGELSIAQELQATPKVWNITGSPLQPKLGN